MNGRQIEALPKTKISRIPVDTREDGCKIWVSDATRGVRVTDARGCEMTSVRSKIESQLVRGIIGHEDDIDRLLCILNERYGEHMTDAEVTEFKRLAERWYFSVMPKPDWMTWDEFYAVIQN